MQRLKRSAGFINPWGNTALDIKNKDVAKLFMSIVDPSYMGAAEYEWGALPECLSKMWDTI